MNLIDAKVARIPTIPINLDEAPAKRWRNAGEEHAEQIQEVAALAWEDLMSYADQLPRSLAWLTKVGASPVGGVAGRFASLIGGEYADELRGLAKGAKVSFGKIFILNLSYDICQFLSHGGQACSSASFTDSRGRPILARNLDWAMPEGLGPFTAIVEKKKRGRSYQSIGVLGFVGVHSAIRDGAWAVTLNQAPCLPSMPSKFLYPACMHLRNACDSSFSYRSLKRNMADWRPMTPFLAHVVGTTREEQSLIQHAGEYFWETDWTPDHGPMAQTNHFLDPEDGYAINEETGWGSECDRLSRLQSRLKRGGFQNLQDGFRLLKGEPLTYECTIQQMVMRPATGSLNLRVQM